MYGRRNQRKRGFRRTLVMLLTLVMLASVCFPGLRASAEGENADVVVKAGEKTERSVSGKIGDIFVSPQDGGLVCNKEDGKIIVDATNATTGTYQVVYVSGSDSDFGVEVTFTVLVTSAVEPNNLKMEIEPASTEDDETDAADPTEEPAAEPSEEATTAPSEEMTVATEEAVTQSTEETTVATEEAVTEPMEETTVATEEAATDPTEETTAAVEETVEGADVMGAPNISTYASPASLTIEQGKSGTSTLSQKYIYGFTSSVNPANSGITVTQSNGTVTISVGQNVPTGSYTVTVNYDGSLREETINVTVKEAGNETNRPAAVFFLKLPTNDPISNAVGQWSDSSVTYNGANASVNMTGAKWEDRIYEENEVQKIEKNKNVFENVSSFIISWPDGSTGATWTLDKTTYSSEYRQVYNAYKASLESDLEIKDLTLDDIESITLIPFKISQNNGGSVPTHIDCKVSVVCKKAFTATFYVKEPGKNIYEIKHSENYKIVNGSAEAIKQYTVSDSIVGDDGITYKFDGWHVESVDGVIVTWDYHPTEQDLEDGEVNFYAHYVPVTTSITITKTVTGNMGDWNKEFTFNVNSGTENQTITLKNGESQIISGLTIGSDITVIESDNTGYTVTYRLSTDAENVPAHTGSTATTTVSEGLVIAFTNNKEAQIDTGIFTDTAPYILLFSIAAVGAAVLLNKRRYQY